MDERQMLAEIEKALDPESSARSTQDERSLLVLIAFKLRGSGTDLTVDERQLLAAISGADHGDEQQLLRAWLAGTDATAALDGSGRTLLARLHKKVVLEVPIVTYVSDTFTRTVVNNWGTADVGGVWTPTDTAANFDVANGVGTIVISSANNDLDAKLASVSYKDALHRLKFKADKLAVGAAQKLKLHFRKGTNYYYVFVVINTNRTMQIQARKMVSAVDTGLGTLTTIPGLTYSANQYYNVKWRVRDLLPTALEKGVSWLNWHTWGDNTGSNFTGQAADAADLVAAKCDWVRTRVRESDSFTALDNFVAILAANGLKWNCTIRKSTPALSAGTVGQRDAFKTWLTNFVNRYDDYVNVYEIGNEPNLPEFWTIDYTNDTTLAAGVADYVTHLRDAYETIKALRPTAVVVNGGFSSGDIAANGTAGSFGRFIDQFVIAGGPSYLDRTAFHPYASSTANNVVAVNALITKMAQSPSWAAKPIWLNECGYSTHVGAGGPEVADEATKATRLTAMFNGLRNVAGVMLPIFWYTLHDANVSDNGFGLLRRNTSTLAATYLDAFTAFQTLWEGSTPEAEIAIKLWQDGQTEPASYPYTIADTSIMAAGAFGVEARLDGGTSNAPVTFSFDDILVTDR